MNTTFNFEVSSEAKKDGTYPVYLRITENSRHTKIRLDAYVRDKSHFKAQAPRNNWISTKEPLHKVFNQTLASVLEQAYKVKSTLEAQGNYSVQALADALKGKSTLAVMEFIGQMERDLLAKGQVESSMAKTTLVKYLSAFTGGKDLFFPQINKKFVAEFESYLCSHKGLRGRPLSRTSISQLLITLRICYNKAKEYGYVPQESNPFFGFKVKKDGKHRSSLTQDEVEKIKALDLECGSRLWHARNCFLFSMYMAGIRFGDLATLKWENVSDGRLVYTMHKTGKTVDLAIIPPALEILKYYEQVEVSPEDFIFPLGQRPVIRRLAARTKQAMQKRYDKTVQNRRVNVALEEIARKAGIDKHLTFHIARHTFASVALWSEGNIQMISQLLGHSSISITQTYLSGFSRERQDDFLRQAFG